MYTTHIATRGLATASESDVVLVAKGGRHSLETFAATGDGDIKKLATQADPTWRLRVGNWRILFGRTRTDNGPAIVVVAVANRRDAHRSGAWRWGCPEAWTRLPRPIHD